MSRSFRIFRAFAVHVFTTLGLLAAFMAIIAIQAGEWRTGYLWLTVCFIIDGLDGTLARKMEVEHYLPSYDGKAIDFVVDFITYAFIPAFFFYNAGMVNSNWLLLLVFVMLLSAGLYYGKKTMVVDDQYFIGFPVLWNIVVFYLFFVLGNNEMVNIISVLFFAVLHFVPIKYAYPSKSKRFKYAHLIASFIGIGSGIWVLYEYPTTNIYVSIIACLAAFYFLVFAVLETIIRDS
jgi:phosphatidylcholine synthase